MLLEGPRSLRDPEIRRARRAQLDAPHMAPLRGFAESLRREGRGSVPEFDPKDGGIRARALFLMEKPGPMTDDLGLSGRIGSGFVSRDNDDPTAEATFRFMQAAGIDRRQTITWNTIPWWNGMRAITVEEITSGLERLGRLIDLLPELRVVVGVGSKARKAGKLVLSRGLPFHASAHPSPINRATRPATWARIPDQWRIVVPYLDQDNSAVMENGPAQG